MGYVVDRAEEFVSELAVEGIRCVLERRHVQPACILIERPSMTPEGHLLGRPCEERLVQWSLTCLVKGADDLVAWRSLDSMLDVLFRLYGQNILSAEPGMFETNETTSAPSYVVLIEESV